MMFARLICRLFGHKFQAWNPMPGRWTYGFCRRCGDFLERKNP